MPPRESDNVSAMRSAHIERLVIALGEQFGQFGAKLQKLPRPGEFQPAIRPLLHQLRPIRRLQRRERGRARGKIHRPAVVGIDERKIPEFRALIEIRQARHHRLQRDLAQRVQCAQQRNALRQRFEGGEKFRRGRAVQDTRDKGFQPVFVSLMRVEPARLLLAFARRFQRIGLHPLDEALRRPAARPRAVPGTACIRRWPRAHACRRRSRVLAR